MSSGDDWREPLKTDRLTVCNKASDMPDSWQSRIGANVCNRSKIGTLNGWRPGRVSALPTLNPTSVVAYDGSVRLSSQDSSARVDVDCARNF